MPLIIRQIPVLDDNYAFLLHDEGSGETVSIDSPDPERILAACASEGWALTQIWNTHHHWDHAGGNAELKAVTGAVITAPLGEGDRIKVADRRVRDGDTVSVGTHRARVIATPGHTLGHIVYHFEALNIAFVGDTLFAMGCGRLFEGSPAQMQESLAKLRALPPETTLYCAHEYTLANAAFAMSVEPGNRALESRFDVVKAQRAKGLPTVPTRIDIECATNPFLRWDSGEIARSVGADTGDPVEVFAKTRAAKDVF